MRARATPLSGSATAGSDGFPGVAGLGLLLASLGLLTLFALALIAFRILHTHSSLHSAIAWNLFLAWIPLVAALIATRRVSTGRLGPGLVAAGVVWLMFLPNAPYMITDLKYVDYGFGDDVPVLYDVLLLSAAAWTGLIVGLFSLLLMHTIARRFVGALKGWGLVVAVLALCSFGIYLGRVQRWNSWDVFVRPLALGHAASSAALHLHPLALTILFTCFLFVTYLVLYAFAMRPARIDTYTGTDAGDGDEAEAKPRLFFAITLSEHGGAQTYLSSLLPAVAERFDVTVAAHGPGPLRDAARAAGVRFVELRHVRRAVSPLHDVLGLCELIGLFRRARPEIVHANSSKAGVLARVAALAAGVPIRIFTVHGWAFAAYDGLAGRLYLWADRLVRPLTTLVICVSRRELELGLRARTCREDSAVVVHNAVDATTFRRATLEGEPPQIVCVGRFAYPKDHDTLLRALAGVDSDFRALLIGDGPDQAAVAGAIGRLRIEQRVWMLGARTDVPELLADADLFVLSSRSEGLPLSILEAMAAGLPVVASDVGGVSELVVDGETGLLVPPGDVTALAVALERLLGDAELRRELGTAARSRVEHEFDVSRFRDAHVELYRRELERRGLPQPAAVSAEAAEQLRVVALGQRSSRTPRRIGTSTSE